LSTVSPTRIRIVGLSHVAPSAIQVSKECAMQNVASPQKVPRPPRTKPISIGRIGFGSGLAEYIARWPAPASKAR
jgi:hypothetical protein